MRKIAQSYLFKFSSLQKSNLPKDIIDIKLYKCNPLVKRLDVSIQI